MYKHMRTCHKKKDIKCRFCTPWLVTQKTIIVHVNSDFYNILKKSKGRIDKVLMNYWKLTSQTSQRRRAFDNCWHSQGWILFESLICPKENVISIKV